MIETPPGPFAIRPASSDLNTVRESEYQAYLELLLNGRRSDAAYVARSCYERGVDLRDIYLGLFQRSQREIGDRWAAGTVSVAQEHYSTAATQLIMSQFYSHLFATPRNGHRLVATCAEGELHEVGIRIVSDFLELEGWDTYYLGASAPSDTVVKALARRQAEVLLVSATMPHSLRNLERMIAAVRRDERTNRIPIVIGGLALSDVYWKDFGADAYGRDADHAVRVVRSLIQTRSSEPLP